MAEVLLQELSNADIDWLVTNSQREKITAGTILIEAGRNPDAVYLLLDGSLTITAPQSGGCSDQTVAQLSRGEIVGVNPLLDAPPTDAFVRADQDSMVLSIAQSHIAEKLRQDVQFAAHFYRAIALILSERTRRMYEMPERLSFEDEQPVKEALFVFGELQDSDIDWLVAAGRVEKLAPDQVLLHAGRPVDALYIVLDGLLSVSVPEGQYDSLSLCFKGLEQNVRSQKVIANFSRGELAGIISFLDFQPMPVTIRSVTESLVFAVPRPQLTVKLQQDVGFASRFYRVIAIQTLDLLRVALDHLGCPQRTYSKQQQMDEDVQYSDELDLEALHQMSQGANRFNWMLRRLGVGYAV